MGKLTEDELRAARLVGHAASLLCEAGSLLSAGGHKQASGALNNASRTAVTALFDVGSDAGRAALQQKATPHEQ